MTQKDFINSLDIPIRESLMNLLKETKEYDSSISKADDKSKAQLWVALALLNHKISQVNFNTVPKKKIPKEEMDKILKTLETL